MSYKYLSQSIICHSIYLIYLFFANCIRVLAGTDDTLKDFNWKELNKRGTSRETGRVKGTNKGSKNKRELSLPLGLRDKRKKRMNSLLKGRRGRGGDTVNRSKSLGACNKREKGTEDSDSKEGKCRIINTPHKASNFLCRPRSQFLKNFQSTTIFIIIISYFKNNSSFWNSLRLARSCKILRSSCLPFTQLPPMKTNIMNITIAHYQN